MESFCLQGRNLMLFFLYPKNTARYRQAEEDIKFVTNIALVSRYLERIGDQSVNIGDRVLYFLTGDYTVFHDDLSD